MESHPWALPLCDIGGASPSPSPAPRAHTEAGGEAQPFLDALFELLDSIRIICVKGLR